MDDYDYIRFAAADIYGRSRGRIVPKRHAQKYIENGASMFGGTLILGINGNDLSVPMANYDSDSPPHISLRPDMKTLHSVPWCGGDTFKVGEVICDSYWLKDRTPQVVCPRYVVRQQLDRLAKHDLKLLSGFEMEYLLMAENESFLSKRNLLSHREHAKRSEILFDIENSMFLAGVDIENFHSEYDPGQFEMVLGPRYGIDAVDAAFTFKNGVQELADKNKYRVSFKSRIKNTLSGMHFNYSLWSVSENKNVFMDKMGELTDTARHWLGGLLKHAKALTAFYSPTVNCYERLHQPHKPGCIFWDLDDRSACIRFRLGTTDNGVYFENRMPSGISNPYVVLAATVAAGLDGVLNKLECPPPGKTATAEVLPQSLSEALRCLMEDSVLVDGLGKEFVECYAGVVSSDIE